MTQPEGNTLCYAQSGEPIPGEEACNGHAQPRTRGGNGLEERCRSGGHVAVQDEVTVVAEDADRQRAGMPVDPAVTGVRRGVEAPEVSSS
jgi:hypothetical protein